jgi:hypothetical protein
MTTIKFRFKRADSKHEGQIDVVVKSVDDPHDQESVQVWFDNVGVLLNAREKAALSAAIRSNE